MWKRTTLAALVVSLWSVAVAVAAPPTTPDPRSRVTPPKPATPTPLPSLRKDLPLNLPPCTVAGTLKWDAQLLASSNNPPPNYGNGVLNGTAYSGVMTITASRDFVRFLVNRVEAGFVGHEDYGFQCSGWDGQSVALARNQSKTYNVRCTWAGTYNLPFDARVRVWYEYLLTNGEKWNNLGYCEGRVAMSK